MLKTGNFITSTPFHVYLNDEYKETVRYASCLTPEEVKKDLLLCEDYTPEEGELKVMKGSMPPC